MVHLFSLCVGLAFSTGSAAQLGPPGNLRVEGLLPEVAILSEPKPQFSFVPPASPAGEFNITQLSYRITVSHAGAATPIWDSGNVASQATLVEYSGPALSAFAQFVWTAEVTVVGGATSDAAESFFETGPITSADWHNASWLTAAAGRPNQYRFEFEVPAGGVGRARAYVASPGCASVLVNGQLPAVDLRGICPWVAGDEHANARYQTHDITAAVTSGKNAIGLVAGNVMTGSATAIAIVVVHPATDGADPIVVASGPGWQSRGKAYVTRGEAWQSDIDWTLEEAGWASPSFSAAGWTPTAQTANFPMPLRALLSPLSAVLNEVRPVKVEALPGGDFLYTFPKNFVGTVKVKALPAAASGSSLSILTGEWLEVSAPPPPRPPPPPPAPPPGPPAQCAESNENSAVNIGGCPAGKAISDITFASFGVPLGTCQTGFKVDPKCNAKNSVAVVRAACIGKASCSVDATDDTFNGDPCLGRMKRLAVEVRCSTEPAAAAAAADAAAGTIVTTRTVLDQADPLPPLPPPGNGTWPQISGSKQQYENHILRATNANDLQTMFCWHGFQYVRVSPTGATGFAGGLDDIVGLEIHTNMTQVGHLGFGGDGVPGSVSDQAAWVLDGIVQMTLQSQRTNVAAYIPTDCPTREKHGWMGDLLDASEQALYNFDTMAMHTAFMQTIRDNQGASGDVPVVIPSPIPGKASCNDIAWTSAYPQVVSMLQSYYGDIRIVERHWTSLVSYQENLIRHANASSTGIAECDQFQDWLCGNAQSCCSHTPAGSACPVGPEMGGFNYVLGLRAMASMAGALGNASQAARYSGMASKATAAFHTAFWNPAVGAYGGDIGATQSLTTPALFIDSPPASLYPKVVQTLATDLAQNTGYNPFVGAVTSKILLNVLSDNGLHETALKTATTTTAPSWGYWWTMNSSTCWESWPLDSGHGSGTVNHIFLCGGVLEWMWKHMVGLTATAPQFAEVSMHPKVHPVVGPSSVSGSYLSPRGRIASAWNLTNGGVGPKASVLLNVSLPVGVQRAQIVVPKPFTSTSNPSVETCNAASEHASQLDLWCPEGRGDITTIDWAAWGTPKVTAANCSAWAPNSTCNADPTVVRSIVSKLCVGKQACTIVFGQSGASVLGNPCPMTIKTLAVRATCGGGESYAPVAAASVSVGGTEVWDGKQLVGSHPGVSHGADVGDGISFETSNGVFSFEAIPVAE